MDPFTARLVQGTTAFQTLNNQSNAISVFNNGPDPTIAYLGLSSRERNETHDFTATSFGMHTTCRPITEACGLGQSNDTFVYNCLNGTFAGNLSIQSVGLPQGYFIDFNTSQLSQGGVNNPFDYAVTSFYQTAANPVTNIAEDPDVVMYPSDFLAVILTCRVTLLDVEYDMVEGNVTRLTTRTSNTSVANVLVPALENTSFGWSSLSSALQIASVVAEDAQDLANQFAMGYSKVALSIGASSILRTPATAAQVRSSILVAKVPKAPLLLLLIVNLAFVVMGFVLAIMAARTSQEAHEVQSRFTIAGIVANMFEGEKAGRATGAVERLFGEYWEGSNTNKVGVDRTSKGGYVFRVIDKELDGIAYHSRD